MKKIELDQKEKEAILEELYKSFETGYDFEDFLKPLLECLGLDEVRVTKRSGDGGVDLEGIRYGVINNNDDSVKYIVQAKRFKPSEKIAVDIIDKLRGNMASGEKGIVITELEMDMMIEAVVNGFNQGLQKDGDFIESL